MSYQQLTVEDRYQIYSMNQVGFSQAMIGSHIGCDKSTVSRELSRNRGQKGYRPKQAHEKSVSRRKEAAQLYKFTEEVHFLVVYLLLEKWSPEQISGWLKKEFSIEISHERIYQFIREDKDTGGDLYSHLRQSSKRRRKKYGSKTAGRGQIKDRVSISERPKTVDKKQRIGDWEGDSVVSSNNSSSLVTLVDRKAKFTLIERVPNRLATTVEKAVKVAIKPHRKQSHTMTFDNGKEFANHKSISKGLGIKIYFADPYSSWQRGLNENTNGLIRQYFPKKTDFKKVSDEEVLKVQEALNSRPRKSLKFQTPNEVWAKTAQRSG
jgi:transposase, IS30 family